MPYKLEEGGVIEEKSEGKFLCYDLFMLDRELSILLFFLHANTYD